MVDRIAEALAAEREAALAPISALADEWYTEAAFDTHMLRIYAADNLRARIRRAAEDAE
jgi:hypothetical protein